MARAPTGEHTRTGPSGSQPSARGNPAGEPTLAGNGQGAPGRPDQYTLSGVQDNVLQKNRSVFRETNSPGGLEWRVCPVTAGDIHTATNTRGGQVRIAARLSGREGEGLDSVEFSPNHVDDSASTEVNT